MTATIDAKKLKEIGAGSGRGQWIDVRSTSEYATGHLPGAINIPLEQIGSAILRKTSHWC